MWSSRSSLRASAPASTTGRHEPIVEIGGRSEAGPRPDNQDRFVARHDLLILSDGMGGYDGGGRAAELSVAAALRVFQSAPSDARDAGLLRDAFAAANHDVRRERVGPLANMGATLSIAMAVADDDGLTSGRRWMIGHVGDSPVFFVRDSAATRLTVDHTVPGLLLQQGLLTHAEAAGHPQRNMLLHAVGTEDDIEPDVVEVATTFGDSIILLSDGVSDIVSVPGIVAVVTGAQTADAAAHALVDEARRCDPHDNMTAVVVRVVASSIGDGLGR